MGVAEVSLLRMYNICVQQPASQAILRRSAWSIPMFRADAPTIHLTNRRTFALFTRKQVVVSAGKLDECSDKLGPIVGNQGESSDRQATIRSQSGLSLTGDGNLYCSFLLKSSLLS